MAAPHASVLGCGGGKCKQPQRHSASPAFPAVHRRSAWRGTHSEAGCSGSGGSSGGAADSVTAFDVVDADGMPVRVTAETDADLFWALRGGGGDFAIVTSME